MYQFVAVVTYCKMVFCVRILIFLTLIVLLWYTLQQLIQTAFIKNIVTNILNVLRNMQKSKRTQQSYSYKNVQLSAVYIHYFFNFILTIWFYCCSLFYQFEPREF